MKDYIANVMIMPKAVWEKIDSANLVKETNLKPIGSGPFTVDKADQTQINLVRSDRLLGEGGLRRDAGQGHEPPDLQEQQRR